MRNSLVDSVAATLCWTVLLQEENRKALERATAKVRTTDFMITSPS